MEGARGSTAVDCFHFGGVPSGRGLFQWSSGSGVVSSMHCRGDLVALDIIVQGVG